MGSIPRPGDSEKVFTFWTRQNSICFNLTGVHGAVKEDAIEGFVKFVLKIPEEFLVDVQMHPVRKFLLVQVKEEAVNSLEAIAEAGVVWPRTSTFVSGWRCDSPSSSIRLFGVSPDKTENEINKVLSRYGEVKGDIIRGRMRGFGGRVTDGTVILRMYVTDQLPPYIKFEEEGEIWRISGDQIRDCCWKCAVPGHLGWQCTARPPAKSWAETARSGQQVRNEEKEILTNEEEKVRKEKKERKEEEVKANKEKEKAQKEKEKKEKAESNRKKKEPLEDGEFRSDSDEELLDISSEAMEEETSEEETSEEETSEEETSEEEEAEAVEEEKNVVDSVLIDKKNENATAGQKGPVKKIVVNVDRKGAEKSVDEQGFTFVNAKKNVKTGNKGPNVLTGKNGPKGAVNQFKAGVVVKKTIPVTSARPGFSNSDLRSLKLSGRPINPNIVTEKEKNNKLVKGRIRYGTKPFCDFNDPRPDHIRDQDIWIPVKKKK